MLPPIIEPIAQAMPVPDAHAVASHALCPILIDDVMSTMPKWTPDTVMSRVLGPAFSMKRQCTLGMSTVNADVTDPAPRSTVTTTFRDPPERAFEAHMRLLPDNHTLASQAEPDIAAFAVMPFPANPKPLTVTGLPGTVGPLADTTPDSTTRSIEMASDSVPDRTPTVMRTVGFPSVP
eukprot:417181-Rhodomonas_salina.2